MIKMREKIMKKSWIILCSIFWLCLGAGCGTAPKTDVTDTPAPTKIEWNRENGNDEVLDKENVIEPEHNEEPTSTPDAISVPTLTDCTNLTSVTLPEGEINIAEDAFENSGYKEEQ